MGANGASHSIGDPKQWLFCSNLMRYPKYGSFWKRVTGADHGFHITFVQLGRSRFHTQLVDVSSVEFEDRGLETNRASSFLSARRYWSADCDHMHSIEIGDGCHDREFASPIQLYPVQLVRAQVTELFVDNLAGLNSND